MRNLIGNLSKKAIRSSVVTTILPTVLVVLGTSPLFAGNILVTGHDDDLHGSPNGLAQLGASINFVRNGSALPVLVFDQGSQLTGRLTTLGVSFTNVNPALGIPVASLFDPTIYSAIAVASDQSCGGCDNSVVGSTNLAGASAAIGSFLNSGRGIFALTSGSNAGYYNFIGLPLGPFGSPPSTGYALTPFGASIPGMSAVNGDFTHNFFSAPGTGGTSAAFQVVESLTATGQAVTLACVSCSISGGVIISDAPEPSTFALFGAGILGIFYRRRKK